MKAGALILTVLLWQAAPANEPPVAQPGHLRYLRALTLPAGAGQACAVLDAQVFPHAEPALIDLRLFPAAGPQHEVPYAITMSQAVTEETQPARLLNLGSVGGKIVFDLEMPERAYSDVALDLDPNATNFLATATVTGVDQLGGRGKATALGSFTLFDLSSQHLSRDTTLPLEESTFHYLHVALSVSPAPGSAPGAGPAIVPAMVRGAQVPPSREEQIVYTMVAQTSSLETAGRESRATFEVPARVPVERVEFVLAPGFKANFSRDVKATATAEPLPKGAPKTGSAEGEVDNDERAQLPEIVTGNILRVHANEAGREIRTEELGFPAVLGANLQRPAKVEVAIENGDDQPLPIAQVRLEMRQRELCFDAGMARGAGAEVALSYGDPALLGPVYDYERLFVAADKPLVATLGPEQLNPHYAPRPQAPLSFTERHPEVLWIALIAAICALGLVAIRSSRNVGRST